MEERQILVSYGIKRTDGSQWMEEKVNSTGGIKRWSVYCRNMKLAKKMLLLYLAFTSLACCIAVGALQISLTIYDEKLYEKSLQELEFFTKEISRGLEDAEEMSYALITNQEVQSLLTEASEVEYLSQSYAFQMNSLRRLMQMELNFHPTVKNVIYTDAKQVSFTVGTYCGTIEESLQKELLDGFREKRGGYVFRNPKAEYPYLLSGRDILEIENTSLDYLGSFLLTVDVAGIIDSQESSLEAEHAALFVYSGDGMIYQGKAEVPPLPAVGEKQGYQIQKYHGQKYFMCYLQSAETGWMYVNSFPYSDIFGQIMQVRYGLVLSFLLVFGAAILVMRRVLRTVLKPLEHLTQSMQIVETGDFQTAREVLHTEERTDEIGVLAQEFQLMLLEIEKLIHENYEKQLLLKDTKYRMLQAQINPHFLYNTLNTIHWMIRAKRNDDAGKMIMELGSLLRASFAREPYTTVEEELNSLKSYLTIQQYRYQKHAIFKVETKGEPGPYLVPRMILQPLVENSILYGMEQSLNVCEISVTAIEEREYVLLGVEDTGVGMNQEELDAVRNLAFVPKGHGIGLKNIRERLRITYEDSEFCIDSAPGEGTRIQIRIPKKEMRENVSIADRG